MSIKGLRRDFSSHSYNRRSSILDKTITVKDILVYGGYGLLGLLLLAIVVLIPFMIGRASVNCDCDVAEVDVKETKVDAATSLINGVADNISETEDEVVVEPDPKPELEPEPEPKEEIVDVLYDEDARYLRTDSRVAITYTDVDVDLVSFDYEMRGSDWGTINEVKILITNNQEKIVIPYTLKMKIYNVGDHASDWWDDEVNLRDHLNIIVPGGYKQITLDSHVSFSESDTDKRLVIAVFDEVGKLMTSRTRDISIE